MLGMYIIIALTLIIVGMVIFGVGVSWQFARKDIKKGTPLILLGGICATVGFIMLMFNLTDAGMWI